jgi:hypothetical protein
VIRVRSVEDQVVPELAKLKQGVCIAGKPTEEDIGYTQV